MYVHLTLVGLCRPRCLVIFIVDICGHVYALRIFRVEFWIVILYSPKGAGIGPGAGGVWSVLFRPRKKKKKEKFRGVLHYV